MPTAAHWPCLVILAAILVPGPRAGAEDAGAAGIPAISPEEYRARRTRVLETMLRGQSAHAVLLLTSGGRADSPGGMEHAGSGSKDLFYLTGIGEPGAALLLAGRPVEGIGKQAVLFLEPRKEGQNRWTVPLPGTREVGAACGIPQEAILAPERLPGILAKALSVDSGTAPALEPRPRLYFHAGGRTGPGEPLPEGYAFLLARLGTAAFHLDLRDPNALLIPLRKVKSPAEIARIRRSAVITAAALRSVIREVRPGDFEYQVAARIEAGFRLRGASGSSFTPIVGSGPNACILHYDRYDRRIAADELVLMDVGAEIEGYAADVTRTVPASGRFTPRQKRLHDILTAAQEAGLRAVRPGATFEDVEGKVKEAVAAGLQEMGLIAGPLDVHRYLPHGTSHAVGLDVHDPVPDRRLEAGMVITLEPGIYIPEESLGLRLEDDVLVTGDGGEILSGGVPRTAEALERWLRPREY